MMKEKLLVICDAEEEYLIGIQNYFVKKKLIDFQIKSFSDIEQLKAFCCCNSIEILLLNEVFLKEFDEELPVKQLFLLSDEKLCEEYEESESGYAILYKYQSAEKILSFILDCYARNGGCSRGGKKDKNTPEVIIFYSPDGQSNQTVAALAAGQVLSEQKRVLYLNLSLFSGLEKALHTSFESDLSDFIYFAWKHSERLAYKLEAMKKRVSGLDYIAPARNPKDLLQIDEVQWETIWDALFDMGNYQEIIIEVTDACRGLERLLDRADRIYTLYGESRLAGNRLSEYQTFCASTGRKAILEKTGFIPEPLVWREEDYDYGALALVHPGQYMKGILSEDGIM